MSGSRFAVFGHEERAVLAAALRWRASHLRGLAALVDAVDPDDPDWDGFDLGPEAVGRERALIERLLREVAAAARP